MDNENTDATTETDSTVSESGDATPPAPTLSELAANLTAARAEQTEIQSRLNDIATERTALLTRLAEVQPRIKVLADGVQAALNALGLGAAPRATRKPRAVRAPAAPAAVGTVTATPPSVLDLIMVGRNVGDTITAAAATAIATAGGYDGASGPAVLRNQKTLFEQTKRGEYRVIALVSAGAAV